MEINGLLIKIWDNLNSRRTLNNFLVELIIILSLKYLITYVAIYIKHIVILKLKLVHFLVQLPTFLKNGVIVVS